MTTAAVRLRAAREAAGYATAADAARAMGVRESGYTHHENATRGFDRQAARYARFFRVSLDWLLAGRGEMRARGRQSVPVMGIVTAGASAVPSDEEEAAAALGDVSLPDPDEVRAFRVEGDSQWPRFQHGEFVLVARRALSPEQCLGRYALVQLLDGRRLLKTVARGPRPGLYTLESHNAPALHEVEILGCWPFRGVLG